MDAGAVNLLDIENVSVCYQGHEPAVKNVSLSLAEREILSIVGESGSGKTTLIRAILGILPPGGKITGGKIIFEGNDLTELKEEQMMPFRGSEMAMIFQDVGASLDPIRTIDSQYRESILALGRNRYREKAAFARRRKFKKSERPDKKETRAEEVDMLAAMRLTDPERILVSYPFELSGGMKQRVGIAMSMTARPKLLLADEPTSALDVTIQAQVVRQMKELREKYNAAIILVTHNMGVASYLSDRIGVMKKGELVEIGARDEVIFHPQHEYTKQLLAAVPKLEEKRFAN